MAKAKLKDILRPDELNVIADALKKADDSSEGIKLAKKVLKGKNVTQSEYAKIIVVLHVLSEYYSEQSERSDISSGQQTLLAAMSQAVIRINKKLVDAADDFI